MSPFVYKATSHRMPQIEKGGAVSHKSRDVQPCGFLCGLIWTINREVLDGVHRNYSEAIFPEVQSSHRPRKPMGRLCGASVFAVARPKCSNEMLCVSPKH